MCKYNKRHLTSTHWYYHGVYSPNSIKFVPGKDQANLVFKNLLCRIRKQGFSCNIKSSLPDLTIEEYRGKWAENIDTDLYVYIGCTSNRNKWQEDYLII